jgi:hypothetical protein
VSDESPVFERLADELERRSNLSRLETRGTLRLALKEAGLFPRTITTRPMMVVLDRILPGMLARRGIRDPSGLCRALCEFLKATAGGETLDEDSPENVFSRIGGSRGPLSVPPASMPPPSMPPPSMPPGPPSSRSALPPSSRGSPSIAPGPDTRRGSKP